MRQLMVCSLLALLGSDASAACVCVIKVMYRYSNGAAICFAARYEDAECEEGHCSGAVDVWEYRTAKYTKPETCPKCRKYEVARSLSAKSGENDCCAPDDSDPNQKDNDHGVMAGPAPIPDELPVDGDFDPSNARSLEGARYKRIGIFKLMTKGKVATDFTSDKCLRITRDVYVLAFRTQYWGVPGEQVIAYELKNPPAETREIKASAITAVHFEPQVGEWMLRMRISQKDAPKLRGKPVFLLLAKEADLPEPE